MIQRYQVGDTPKDGFVVTDVIPGGMGIIYILELTYGNGPGFKRVLKSCDSEKGLAPDFRKKFERESLLWISLLPHPRIVRAFSFEFDGGLPSLMMEYMPGGSLRDRMETQPMTLSECLRIAIEFCEGMSFLAETNGILHLDIKPENILFDENGHVKITDFGIARAFEDSSKNGRFFEIAGTLPYMAPEQLSGTENLNSRADIYAFGVTLYEMLSGRRPFNEPDARGYERAIAAADVPLLPKEIPTDLNDLVMRCLKSNQGDRIPGFSELLTQLIRVSEQIGISIEATEVESGANSEDNLDSNDWNSRGYANAQANNFDEALYCYKRGLSVLAKEPRSTNYIVTPGVDKKTNSTDAMYAVLYTNMGALLIRMNRINEARAAFMSALEIVPTDGVAYLRLGQIALMEGKISEGLALLKKCTECEPGNNDLLLKYLQACFSYASQEEASNAFEEFILAKKSNIVSLVGAGCLLDEEFGLEPALRCFDAALESDQDSVIAWYNRAVALHRAGYHEDAIESYSNVVRIDRNHSLARCYLGVLLIQHNQKDEGIAHLVRFLETGAPNALTQLVTMILQFARLGIPPENLFQSFNNPLVIKHVL